ncbi:hypothetical protein KC614_00700 [candidate division WWE3 bacterium]|uniref:EfeO-type cupredoxin-like domain-containing protein n=1 Tax=candidate division WWE3 bacterium TaxID=2053526 RepID=A0A955RRM5_UNCKA|nr:hypothetical protein [candidate division WWE3 bacterium]
MEKNTRPSTTIFSYILILFVLFLIGAIIVVYVIGTRPDPNPTPQTLTPTPTETPEPSVIFPPEGLTQEGLEEVFEPTNKQTFTISAEGVSPSEITFKSGDYANWVNNDDQEYTITLSTEKEPFVIYPGAEKTYLLKQTGDFTFEIAELSFVGRIIVTNE